jgi:hypothetical protein
VRRVEKELGDPATQDSGVVIDLFEADWRDAYPGINAVTLMELKDPPDPQREQLLPVVAYAVERRIAAGKPDFWDFATRLELAVLAKDKDHTVRRCGHARRKQAIVYAIDLDKGAVLWACFVHGHLRAVVAIGCCERALILLWHQPCQHRNVRLPDVRHSTAWSTAERNMHHTRIVFGLLVHFSMFPRH